MQNSEQNKVIDIAMAILVVFAASVAVGTCDFKDAAKIEQHKNETIAAAKKVAEHEKAEELRRQKVLDDANQMMWPIAQVGLGR